MTLAEICHHVLRQSASPEAAKIAISAAHEGGDLPLECERREHKARTDRKSANTAVRPKNFPWLRLRLRWLRRLWRLQRLFDGRRIRGIDGWEQCQSAALYGQTFTQKAAAQVSERHETGAAAMGGLTTGTRNEVISRNN